MFKKEISFISDLNLNKLQVVGDRFTIVDLTSSKIHHAILHYINASVDKEIFSDRKRIENNSIFDYKSDRINNYFILISEEIKRVQHFDLKYLKQIVQNAIIFNINFLTNPNKTLTDFIFDDTEIKSIEEIILGISHAYYYRYLQKILLTYLDKKKVLTLTKEEFLQLLERVDVISRETHLEDTLTTAVNSMTNFFDQNSRTSAKLPLKAIQIYLEEKKLTEFSKKLENNFITESSTSFLATDILNVLRSVTPESELILEETSKVEDELIEDDVNTNVDNNNFNGEDVFEDAESEVDIPNDEILSDEEVILEENKLGESEGAYSIGSTKLEEDFEEIIDNDQNGDEPQKKKNDGIKLLNDILDLSPLYESLLTELKPFNDFESRLNLFDNLKNQSEDLNYKIDLTTLKDKLEIVSNDEKLIASDNFENSKLEISKNEEINIFKNDHIKFEDSGDEEYLSAKETLEKLESADNGKNTVEKIDNSISLIEEEITEVFSDLTFLDSKENITANDVIERQIQKEEEQLSSEEDFSDPVSKESYDIHDETLISFSSLLLDKDMSKIIELIFDYDMEEYHSIINKISLCNNEEAAISIVEDYCQNNHIELESNEVEIFKSIISEYFTKSYS